MIDNAEASPRSWLADGHGVFLIAGIWVVRKKYGGVRHVLGNHKPKS